MISAPLTIYFLLPSSIFIAFISLFLFVKKKSQATTIFMAVGLIQLFWTVGTFILWESYSVGLEPKIDLISKVFAAAFFMIPVLLYHFSVEFCAAAKQKLFLLLAYLVSIGFIGISDPQTMITELFFSKLGTSQPGYIYYAFIIFSAILLAMTLYNFFYAWLNKKSQEKEKQNLVLSFFLLFAVFSIAFIFFLPRMGVQIYPIFYLTLPVYSLILGYVIIEKNPLASVITTDILITAVLAFFAAMIIFPQIELTQMARLAIFVVITFISFILFRYMNRIKNQKAEFEEMVKERTKELEDNTAQLMAAKKELEKSNAILETMVKERTKELEQANSSLEIQVSARTKELKKRTQELEEKITELQDFSNIFINRENKMVELKNRLKEMEARISEK
ncbi:MAG: hypothetical protein PHG23_00090 [Candidatus Pacebacteria bacterium]|nr:hypothetical protein [Candidatus Paceibacterota bacterium]